MNHDGWITVTQFCQKYGWRANTITKKFHDGVLQRDGMYSSPSGGRAFVHEARLVAALKLQPK